VSPLAVILPVLNWLPRSRPDVHSGTSSSQATDTAFTTLCVCGEGRGHLTQFISPFKVERRKTETIS
jgi:hypothetical protein